MAFKEEGSNSSMDMRSSSSLCDSFEYPAERELFGKRELLEDGRTGVWWSSYEHKCGV